MSNRLVSRYFGLAALTASLALGSMGFAQSDATTTGANTASTTTEGKRKVKSQTPPIYPELAKQMNLSGKVKLEVVIAQDGRVKSTKVVGGSPLLASASEDAVKKWKFEPASEDTTEVLEFDFHHE